MPSNWGPLPMGPRSLVRDQLSTVVPGLAWNDSAHGSAELDGLGLGFFIGADEPCMSVGVRIVGNGDPIDLLRRLEAEYGWYGFDVSEGEWLRHLDEPGWKAFVDYRDRVTDGSTSLVHAGTCDACVAEDLLFATCRASGAIFYVCAACCAADRARPQNTAADADVFERLAPGGWRFATPDEVAAKGLAGRVLNEVDSNVYRDLVANYPSYVA